RTTGAYAGAGDNSRLDAIQAAILRIKLRHVGSWIKSRRALADAYRRHFSASPHIVHPMEQARESATFNPLVVRANERDGLLAHLRDRGIEARVYYGRPLTQEPRFANAVKHDVTHALEAGKSRIALPLYFGMTEEKVGYVCDAINSFYAR
ncbi:MAG TPA: DegT/DnrJ/EryC1/StrS family aminotransferase, partial [Polyangiaceae bacterium]